MADPRTLLIVDDCAEDRRIYRRYLSKDPHASYRIAEAKTAQAGLELYQQSPSDVVLLDLCLPDMTGLEFLDRLQQSQTIAQLPIIMLTGNGDEAIAVQAIKRGAQDYLVKGNLKADMLQLAVQRVLQQSLLHAQLSRHQNRQQLTATTALRIRQSLDLEQILHTAVVEVRQLLQCDRVLVYQFSPDQSGTIVAESVGERWTSAIGMTLCDSYLQDPTSIVYHEGQTHTITNIDCDPLDACYVDLLNQFEVKASLAVPVHLVTTDAETPPAWGLLIAHQCSAERQWLRDEIELFQELAVQVAIAIQQSNLFTQTQLALAREKELNLFKSQIIATVSHEYRTPLASILAAATTLKQHRDRLDESRQNRFLELIEQKSRQMSSLVDDMLLVQQLEFDTAKFNPMPLDLILFWAEVIEEQQTIAGDRYDFVYRIAGDPFGFWGDRALMRQIATNLVSNAVKYSPNGGAIEVCLVSTETTVTIAIQDPGLGIPPEEQTELFQSFHRASNVDTIPGTGLGLTIVRACVEAHHGTIELTSEVGQGTKISVTLPKRIA